MKRCAKCGEVKPATFEYFGKRKKADGTHRLDSWCKQCYRDNVTRYDRARGVQPRKHDNCSSPGHKICRKCNQEFPFEKLVKNSNCSFGVDALCYPCGAAKTKSYNASNPEYRVLYYRKTRQARIDYSARYRKKNPEKVRLSWKRTREKNKDRRAIQNREWKARNRERIRETSRIYWSKNRDLKKEKDRVYRAKKRSNGGDYTTKQWHRALVYFNGCCAVCGRPLNDLLKTHTAAADHWVSINKGGDSSATNIVPLCHGLDGCNNKKQDLDAQTFLIREFGKQKAKQILARIEAYFEWIRQQNNDPTALP